MDLHEQLEMQQAQEHQMQTELAALVNRFAEEYAVTKYQMAAVLEEQKLRVLGFMQPSDELQELFNRLRETHGERNMLNRIKNAIRVLFGRKTDKERALSEDLRQTGSLLVVADSHIANIETGLENSRRAYREARALHKSRLRVAKDHLAERREKVRDLKRIITELKEKQSVEVQ